MSTDAGPWVLFLNDPVPFKTERNSGVRDMPESMVAFSFFCMVIAPCMIARLICISNDREALVFVRPDPETWD